MIPGLPGLPRLQEAINDADLLESKQITCFRGFPGFQGFWRLLMAFEGFDEKDGEPLYDTLESALERAKMLRAWDGDPDAKIFVQRKRVPLWFVHLVRGTWLHRLAYKELEEN